MDQVKKRPVSLGQNVRLPKSLLAAPSQDNPQGIEEYTNKLYNALKDQYLTPGKKIELLDQLVTVSNHVADVAIGSQQKIEKTFILLRRLASDKDYNVRAAAFRAMRYLLRDKMTVKAMWRQHIAVFVVRSLERDQMQIRNDDLQKHCMLERMHALKLVRRVLEIDPFEVPRTVVLSIVSICDAPDDSFRRVCLQTIRALVVRNPKIVALCHGIPAIMNAIVDVRCEDIAESLLLSMLYVLNDKATRMYIRPNSDLQELVSAFTGEGDLLNNSEKYSRITQSRKAVVTMMRSWTGIVYMFSDPYIIRSLVQTLALPASEDTRRVLFRTFFEMLQATPPKAAYASWEPDEKVSKTVSGAFSSDGITAQRMGPSRHIKQRNHNLLSNYLAVIICGFMRNGLIEVLIDLGKREDRTFGSLATSLLGEILHLADTLLPSWQLSKLHSLPELVNTAGEFHQEDTRRMRANLMLAQLDQFSFSKRLQRETSRQVGMYVGLMPVGTNKWRRLKGVDPTKDRIEMLKIKIDCQMEDAHFRNMINSTNVLLTKEYGKWQWDVVNEILEGPLHNPSRLSDALKTKFIKRLLTFFKPKKNKFVIMQRSDENMHYVRTASQLIEILLATSEGVAYLDQNDLLPQISAALELELKSNIDENNPLRVLSPRKLENTMSYEYFTMIGTLSSNVKGVELLQRHRIFSHLFALSELADREDLCRLIITSLDYSFEDQTRFLLSKVMTSATASMRLYATRHQTVLLRGRLKDYESWGIDLLVTQLFDADAKVAHEAMLILEEACNDPDYLLALILKRPPLLQLGETCRSLLMKFVCVDEGFVYLQDLGWIEPEVMRWKEEENLNYVTTIENKMVSALNRGMDDVVHRQKSGTGVIRQGDLGVTEDNRLFVPMPLHMYGQLVKTEDGCKLLRQLGHVNEFVSTVKEERQQKPVLKRAALWVLGHIGSTDLGYGLIEKMGVTEMVVKIAEEYDCLSLRGTCFYVLGLISRSAGGRRDLAKLNWDCQDDNESAIALPRTFDRLFTVPSYEYVGSWVCQIQYDETVDDRPDCVSEKIAKNVLDLTNHVTQRQAFENLQKMKKQEKTTFANPEVLLWVYQMFEKYRFRLPVRRLLHGVFENVVFTDEDLPDNGSDGASTVGSRGLSKIDDPPLYPLAVQTVQGLGRANKAVN